MLFFAGSFYQPDGSFHDWWSQDTYSNYVVERTCVEQYYSNMSAGPYEYPGSGGPVMVRTFYSLTCVEQYYSNMSAGPYEYPGSGGPIMVRPFYSLACVEQ